MMRALRGLLAVAIVTVGTACAGAATSSSQAGAAENGGARPRARADLLTAEDLRRSQYSNLYDLIRDLRPRWLQTRGVDTINGRPGEVQVHVDGNRMGGISALRSLSPNGVTSIQWVAPVDAAGRFGLDHGHGAIVISTNPG